MEKEEKLKKVVIGLGILAGLLLAALIFIWVSKNNIVGDLQVEKEDLTAQMVELQNEYSVLSSTNDTLNSELEVEREKVNQMIERFKATEATNRAQIRKYEKELGTLRSIMKHYIVQIDSLNTLNVSLREEASSARKEAAESKKQYNDLRSTADEYAKQVEKGSVVKGRGVNLVAINSSNKVTDRSSRVEKLRTDLFLVENSIAKKGPKKVYIRVKGPDGVLLTGGDQKIFNCAGEELIYSASREVDYQGEEVDVSIYLSNMEGFVKGVYTVDVYTVEGKIGSADLMLR